MNFAMEPKAVYRTPTGRRCVWVPTGGLQRESWNGYASFRYLTTGDSAIQDGFMLTASNYHILRREGSHAAGR